MKKAMSDAMMLGLAALFMLIVIAALIYYNMQSTQSTAGSFFQTIFGGLG